MGTTMKKKILISTALTALVSALVGCGGESGNINEDTNNGVTTSTSCKTTDANCQSFYMVYPIAGLNFDCSSDKMNHFVTAQSGNAFTGACKLGDTVNFSIKGQTADKQINLGSLDLKTISPINIGQQPLSLLDMATAMVGKAPATFDLSDDTVKVATALVRIFQALGVQQNSNIAGDIQPVAMTEDFKNGLSKITRSLSVSDFKDGSYAAALVGWVDVSTVSEAQALNVVKKMANIQNAGIYNAEIFTPSSLVDLAILKYTSGFRGSSSTTNKQIIANMYLMTDRQGLTSGYGLLWQGVPKNTGDLGYLTLISQFAPTKMTAQTQSTWLNPLTKSLSSAQPFRFSFGSNSSDDLKIFQGKLLDNYLVVATDDLYKRAMNTTTVDSSVFGRWTKTADNETFNGTIDLAKISPITYLDRRVFKSSNNISSGRYLFPLNATLIFKFTDTSVADVKLGIVIDENGDIRTDIGANATTNDMSGNCGILTNSMQDNFGVTQYRIGTTGAANFSASDKSITIRMILNEARFGLLEGVLLGLNQGLAVSGETSSAQLSSGGVKINLNNLLDESANSRALSITDFNNNSANWANIYAAYQRVYNNISNVQPAPTTAQIELAKRTSGTLSIELPNCYSVKNK